MCDEGLRDREDRESTRAFLAPHVGSSPVLVPVREGVVHHVFRIEGTSATVYLKKRGHHFSGNREIQCAPQDIIYEARAIVELSALLPDIFPHLIAVDEELGMLLMTDVMAQHCPVRACFEQEQVTGRMAWAIGKTLGRVHKLTAGSAPIRGDAEPQYYHDNLWYRLGYHRHPALDQLIDQLGRLPRQLILGDFSPKNMGIRDDGHVSLYDLDAVHHGNASFDVGFFIGHILLHTRGGHLDLITSFLRGYSEVAGPLDPVPLELLALGACLYRLDNPMIPYPLGLDRRSRTRVTKAVRRLLARPCLSWSAICDELARTI
jgi:hypothetical protein